jgi:hypothetical protein
VDTVKGAHNTMPTKLNIRINLMLLLQKAMETTKQKWAMREKPHRPKPEE